MTTATLTKRVERIEARQRPAAVPTWLSVADEADVDAALAAMPDGWRGTCYIGISPDDWDGDD